MNQFDLLLQTVLEEARALQIPVSGRIDPHVQINRRAVTRFGCCICQGTDYRIQLTEGLLQAPEASCRETLAHEVLHTCPGCRNHGTLWKEYARQMNCAYGYHISRTSCGEVLGVAITKPVRHLLVCQRCGQEFPRSRATKLTQHPERYRCKCGGTLSRRY